MSALEQHHDAAHQQMGLLHHPPKNLTQNEIQCLYDILGNNCLTLATAVVQILHGVNGSWIKLACGVLCYIKDHSKRLYCFRLYDLRSKQLLYEEIVPSSLGLTKSLDLLYTFDGANCKVGINFVDHDEAQTFYHYFNTKQEDRLNKRKNKGTTQVHQPTSISRNINEMKAPSSDATQSKKQSTSKTSGFFTIGRKKKDIRSADISNPIISTFTIRNHIGLNGSFFHDPAQKQLFDSVLSKMHISAEDEKYVRDIVENSNGTSEQFSSKSNSPMYDSKNQGQPRSNVSTETHSRNYPASEQMTSCHGPYQDISAPSLPNKRTNNNRPVLQNLPISPPVRKKAFAPVIPPPVPNQPPTRIIPPPVPNQPPSPVTPPRPDHHLPDNTCASIPAPPPMPLNFHNPNQNVGVIVSSEQLIHEPSASSTNSEPTSWLQQINDYDPSKLKSTPQKPPESKVDLNLSPQRAMENYIQDMIKARRPAVMGDQENQVEESGSSDDEWGN